MDDPLDFFVGNFAKGRWFWKMYFLSSRYANQIKIGKGLDNPDQSDTPTHIATELMDLRLASCHTGATTRPLLSCLLSRIHDFFP